MPEDTVCDIPDDVECFVYRHLAPFERGPLGVIGCTFSIELWQANKGLIPRRISERGKYLWGRVDRTDKQPSPCRLSRCKISNVSARENPLNTPEWANCVIWMEGEWT